MPNASGADENSCRQLPDLRHASGANLCYSAPIDREAQLSAPKYIADGPLEVGKRADLRIRLFFFDHGQPVALSDLEETHTRKIHLLISDISETDYHHEHPEPAGDGEYAFSFTPQRPDTYRVWADLRPVRTHVQQYSVANIPSSTWRQAKLR